MGPRSFQIWIWGPKRWPTLTKSGVPCNFCFIKFLPKCTAEAPETPCTRGWGVLGWYPPRTFLPSRTTYLPNFIKIHPAVWISIENIQIHCPPLPPWGAQIKKQNTHLLKFHFREILFYKYFKILKKNYPPLGPPLTPPTHDVGPQSKICLHNFVCLIKRFPKWYDMTG